jgi:hypothetical protein
MYGTKCLYNLHLYEQMFAFNIYKCYACCCSLKGRKRFYTTLARQSIMLRLSLQQKEYANADCAYTAGTSAEGRL